MEQAEKQIEVHSNGEILLFYVDENGQNIDASQLQQYQHENFILQVNENASPAEVVNEADLTQYVEQDSVKSEWTDDEIRRLLVFYIDNKGAFVNDQAKSKHFWAVACKTMLRNKNPNDCDIKLQSLKLKYAQYKMNQLEKKSSNPDYTHLDLCHQAFHDDSNIKMTILSAMASNKNKQEKALANLEELIPAKKYRPSADERVEQMLNFYLKIKRNYPNVNLRKQVWDNIAMELGETGDYWQRRFMNYKQHYIGLLHKRRLGNTNINWPYLHIFDEIFQGDEEFQKKHGISEIVIEIPKAQVPLDWDDTEKTVLAKYYFDCFDEFQDRTIPNEFLWKEIGRLLDKTPSECKKKYDDLKNEHIDVYIAEGVDLRTRKPIQILFDNIISKESQIVLAKAPNSEAKVWEVEKMDKLVQFIYDHLDLFKDSIGQFVCWTAIAKQLGESIVDCWNQWQDLTMLYKTILDDKKEEPEMQIDWRYIDLFDRIFDYGMDTKMLEGLENHEDKKRSADVNHERMENENMVLSDNEDEDNEKESENLVKVSDPNNFKILEYYHKNKDKFTTVRKKLVLWGALARQIGLTAANCAQRFKSLKQMYTANIQREIVKPEKPILWPYYALCKKVFGYRALKSKLKSGKFESMEDWTPKEIKQLISHFSKNFEEISNNCNDLANWSGLAQEINKMEKDCCDKFIELRRSYKRVKTMMSSNSDCKVNWKYYKFFEEIYSQKGDQVIEVDGEESLSELHNQNPNYEEDEYQCIIVLPEGAQLENLSDAQIIVKETDNSTATEDQSKRIIWNKKCKKQLLNDIYAYIKANQGNIINTTEMFTEIGTKFNRTPMSCKRMYYLMRYSYKSRNKSPEPKKMWYDKMLEKIFALKPKFYRPPLKDDDILLVEKETYKDIALPLWKVQDALKYYLEHIEKFCDTQFDRKQAWLGLRDHVNIPLRKIFRKINYLKQSFNMETKEVAREKVEFDDILKQIMEKELEFKLAAETLPTSEGKSDETGYFWSEQEVEQLLVWYLDNLEKFKSQTIVPSYLWMEASNVMNKSALACSTKMSEIRTQYRTMVKENSDALNSWRYHDLCQKIYGTGKKANVNSS